MCKSAHPWRITQNVIMTKIHPLQHFKSLNLQLPRNRHPFPLSQCNPVLSRKRISRRFACGRPMNINANRSPLRFSSPISRRHIQPRTRQTNSSLPSSVNLISAGRIQIRFHQLHTLKLRIKVTEIRF